MTTKQYVGWPSSAGNPGLSRYRKQGLTTQDAVFAEEGNIYGMVLRNPNSNAVYLNFYDAPSNSVAVGGSTNPPILRLLIPGALDANNPGQLIISPGPYPVCYFKNACTIAPVTADSDSSNAAPSSGVNVNLIYAI